MEWMRMEGWAVALEELMMQAGVLDERSRRGREVEYLMNISHMSLALPDLAMHAGEITFAESRQLCAALMAKGWSQEDEPMVWYEMESNLRFPGFHTGVVVGKAHFMKLFRERAMQLGEDFVLKEFVDEFLAAGIIPISLIRWEMTGYDDEIQELLGDDSGTSNPVPSHARDLIAEGRRGGSKIVFQTERDGNMEIYIMNSDGSEPSRLTNHPAADTYPSWSPRGDKIAFVSDRDHAGDGEESGGGEIYLINPDGTGLQRLTDNEVQDSAPRWTPDGEHLVFTSTRESGRASFMMNADGTNVRRVVPEDWTAISPGVSPDGMSIAVELDGGTEWDFQENEAERRAQIWTVRLDGSSRKQLTRMDAYNGFPAWSPDGKWITFDSNPSPGTPQADIWKVAVDGSVTINLTRATGYNEFASWSPDGSKIAFVSSRDGDEEIYVMNADGSGQTRLTFSPGSDWVPSWSPD